MAARVALLNRFKAALRPEAGEPDEIQSALHGRRAQHHAAQLQQHFNEDMIKEGIRRLSIALKQRLAQQMLVFSIN